MRTLDAITITIMRWDGVILLLTLALLNLTDFLITQQLIHIHGFTVEANPLLRYLLTSTGSVYSILWFKGAMLLFLTGVYLYLSFEPRFYATKESFETMLRVVNLIYSAVVVWSLYLYRTSGGKCLWE